MLIALYFVVVDHLIPLALGVLLVVLPTFSTLYIIVCGMLLMLAAAGVHFSRNPGEAALNAIFGGIGYIFTSIIQLGVWIVKNVAWIVRRVYREARNAFTSAGVGPILSRLIAVIVALVALVVII